MFRFKFLSKCLGLIFITRVYKSFTLDYHVRKYHYLPDIENEVHMTNDS